MRRAEVRKVTGTADGSSASYQVITSLYFDSIAAFETALQNPSTTALLADIPNFYAGTPDILIGDVVVDL